MKTAIIIGATGLTGGHLLHLLLNHPDYSEVKIFVRKSTGITHHKLKEYIIDFNTPETWQHLVTGDVLFSALGTTLKKAGSKANQYLIDHTYQYNFAKAAAQNKVPCLALVSSTGADANSRFFYLKMKGELERDCKTLGFETVIFARPNILTGDRKEKRTTEKLSVKTIRFFNSIGLLKSQKPIAAEDVAKALISSSATMGQGAYILTSVQLQTLANNYQ